MKFRNTVALAVLFVALGAYLYFVERDKIAEESKKQTLLSGVDAEKVTGVTLEYPDRKIVLEKKETAWRLKEPLEAEADQSAAQNLVRAVVDAELKRTLEGEVGSPETYGFDKPKVVVTLAMADGTSSPAIRVGRTTPVGYSAFVQLGGDASIRLVSSAFASGMEKEVKDLRDKEILDFVDDEIQRIEIEAPGGDAPTLELVRAEEKKWRLAKPRELAADEGEVRTFLSSLRSLRAQNFYDTPASPGEFGLDPGRRRITLWTGKDDTRKELLVGTEQERDGKKELYVKRAGGDTVFGVGAYAWSNLGKTFNTFRDKSVLAFGRDALASLEVERADGESFRLVRTPPPEATSPTPAPTAAEMGGKKEDEWGVAGAEQRSRKAAAGQLVGDIHGLKGYEVAAEKPADLAEFGLASPAVTFSLVDRDGKSIGRVMVSQVEGSGEDEKKSYAMAEGSDVVYRIRDYLFAHLDKKKVDLVEETAAATPTAGAGDAAASQKPEPAD